MYRVYCDGVYREATAEEIGEEDRLAPPADVDSMAALRKELLYLRQKLDSLTEEENG